MKDLRRVILDSAILVALLGMVAAIARSYFVTPVQIDGLEKADVEIRADVKAMWAARAVDHDLLQRIDERGAAIQRDLQELKARER